MTEEEALCAYDEFHKPARAAAHRAPITALVSTDISNYTPNDDTP